MNLPLGSYEDYLSLTESGWEPYDAATQLFLFDGDEGDPLSVYRIKRGPRVVNGATTFYALVTNGGVTGLFQNAPEHTKLALDAMEVLGFDVISKKSREALNIFGLPEIFSWDQYEKANEKLSETEEEALEQIDDEILGSNFDEGFDKALHRFIVNNRADF